MAAKRLKGIRPADYRRLLQAYSFGLGERRAPYLLYANMKFDALPAEDTKELLEFEWQLRHAGWTDTRILNFLRRHQEEFRRCLAWVAGGCLVDPGKQSADADDSRETWEQTPEVNFFWQHGLEHAGVTIEPKNDDIIFTGLQLVQKKPRDPLDPIVWDVIAHLSVYGTVAVRRCQSSRCGKFFRPKTQRRRFCSDLCRVLSHIPDELSEEIDTFRAKRKKYMRRYRQYPQVKKRIPESSLSKPRNRAKRRKPRGEGLSVGDLLFAELTKRQNSTVARAGELTGAEVIRKKNREPGRAKTPRTPYEIRTKKGRRV